MENITERKFHLPIIHSPSTSSLVLDKSSTLPLFLRNKQGNDNQYSKLHLHDSKIDSPPVFLTEQSSQQQNSEINKVRNIKIDDVIKKASKKLNLSKLDKSKRFEDKFKIFENLNTFVNVKDFLQQMNVLNQGPQNKNQKLPPIHIETGTARGSLIIKKNASNSYSALQMMRENSESPKFNGHQKGFLSHRATKKEVREKDLQEKIKLIQTQISQIADNKNEILNPERKQDAYGLVLDRADQMLTQLNEAEMNLPNMEDTDTNAFYETLQANLINNKFERVADVHINLQQDEMHYVKNLLTFKEEEMDSMDPKYYQEYKARADKVISLLRKATKNIFRKVIEPKKPAKLRMTQNATPEIRNGTSDRDEEDKKLLFKKQFELFVTTSIQKEEEIKSRTQDLQLQFGKMIGRVNNMVTTQKINRKTSLTMDEDSEPENVLNHKINTLHRSYMKTLLECAHSQENSYKNMKGSFRKNINRLEDAYEKELKQLLPKNLESIQDLNSMSVRPRNKIYSRKLLNSLNH